MPAALLAQRPTGVVSSQAIPIVKAFSSENPQNSNVFIHAPVPSNVSHRTTPSEFFYTIISQSVAFWNLKTFC